jgi:NAD(P)-dependent dehydrogenase (short-subunit alcohol dehydrogenase family)
MDVTKEESIERTANSVSQLGKRPLRLVLNVSGYLKPEKSLRQVDHVEALKHLQVNTIGPLLVSKHFSPMFGVPDKNAEFKHPLLVNLSARTGSIGDNHLGGWYSYRLSKAALNQVTRTLAVELGRRGIVCVSLHPGTVVRYLHEIH